MKGLEHPARRLTTRSVVLMVSSDRSTIQPPQPIAGVTVEIPLTRGLITLVDAIDADLASYHWYAERRNGTGNGYVARRRVHGRLILLARVVLCRMLGRELEREEEVDHINHIPLDNRRSNLRLASRQQNVHNVGIRRNNTSGYKGVSFDKERSKWKAQIKINYRNVLLGRFDTPEEAHQAYCEAARKLHGEFAQLE